MSAQVVVIGAGSAGCATALAGARLGLDVVLVDPAPAPGTGALALGMIPAAVLRELVRSGGDFAGAVVERRRVVAEHLAHTARELARSGVRFERGLARLLAPNRVAVGKRVFENARAVVIATGTRPRRPPSFPFASGVARDEHSILWLERLPRSLVIVGAEVVGCEFACLFGALGVEVTLVERRRRLLRCVDHEILRILHARMQELGIVVALEEKIEQLDLQADAGDPHCALRLSSGRVEKCDRLLVLAGREPKVCGLELVQNGIQSDARGFITVDDHCETSRPGVYAVGDVTGPPFRVASGMRHARLAMLHVADREPDEAQESPIAIHTLPEIACVGWIEEALRRLDLPYGVGMARLETTLAGRLRRHGAGLVKLLFQRDDRRLLGLQVIGSGAAELVQLGAAWLQSGTTIEQIADSVFDQPALAEALRLAALDALSTL